MKNLIDHINSIDRDALPAIEGMTPELAERLLNARPFSSEENLLKVEGITPTLLETWKNKLPSEAVNQTKLSASAPKVEKTSLSKDITEPATKKSSAGRVIFRILIAILILAAIAAAAYYGIPYFREKVLNPLESNTTRVGELAATQAADASRLEEDLAALQGDVVNLQEQVATLQSQAAAADESITAHSANLQELAGLQATLRAEMDEQNTGVMARMDEQLTLTRALELLSRGRLYLSQNNYGMARADVSAARDLLFPLLETISDEQAVGLRVVINRLDMALANLPAYPVVAVFDVDTAWQLLVDGLPAVPDPLVTPLVTTQTLPPTETPEAAVTPLPAQTSPVEPTATP